MKLLNMLAATVALAIAASSADAATLLTSEAGYTGRGLNLSAFANGSYNFTFGPVNVDGFVFTVVSNETNSGLGGVLGQGGYGLGDNGAFGGDAVYAAVDAPTGYFQLLGTVGYSQMGFLMNYFAPPLTDQVLVSSLDANGNVIDSFNLLTLAPISTPNGFNDFRFRGIDSDGGPLIYGLRMEGSYILATGTRDGVPPVDTPAPGALALFGLGAIALGARRR